MYLIMVIYIRIGKFFTKAYKFFNNIGALG